MWRRDCPIVTILRKSVLKSGILMIGLKPVLEAESNGYLPYLPLSTPATRILYVLLLLRCGSCSISAHVPTSFFPSRHRVPPQCLTLKRPMTSTLSCQVPRWAGTAGWSCPPNTGLSSLNLLGPPATTFTLPTYCRRLVATCSQAERLG